MTTIMRDSNMLVEFLSNTFGGQNGYPDQMAFAISDYFASYNRVNLTRIWELIVDNYESSYRAPYLATIKKIIAQYNETVSNDKMIRPGHRVKALPTQNLEEFMPKEISHKLISMLSEALVSKKSTWKERKQEIYARKEKLLNDCRSENMPFWVP